MLNVAVKLNHFQLTQESASMYRDLCGASSRTVKTFYIAVVQNLFLISCIDIIFVHFIITGVLAFRGKSKNSHGYPSEFIA